jgi:hypothetical protein
MNYFILVIFLYGNTYIESYETKAECEVRREQIRIETRSATTRCIEMESRTNVG